MPDDHNVGRFIGIAVDPSMGSEALEYELATSLRANALDPKLLYVTSRQTELWRQVFLKHSPIHGNPEFGRIYRDAFSRVCDSVSVGKIWLVGLGCGTGLKEKELCARLRERGKEVIASPVDASFDLVVQSTDALVAAGARAAGSLAGDLAHVDYLAKWLDEADVNAPRLFTFFGLVPNFDPLLVARIFHAILRPGDILLVSAHLAPVGEGIDVAAAMKRVLPQYDNPETLAWLGAALEQWDLKSRVEELHMTIGDIGGVPAFLATARWKSGTPPPLQVFRSLRYTPDLFEAFLRREGFAFEMLAITACREEAIWMVRR